MTDKLSPPSATLSRDEIERFRRGDILLSDEQANRFCDLALSALSEIAQKPVAWRYKLKGSSMPWRLVESESDCNQLASYEREPLFASFPSTTPQKPVDPESEAANQVWDLVIAKCHSAYPERQGMHWGESPLELITEIIDDRDNARRLCNGWMKAALDMAPNSTMTMAFAPDCPEAFAASRVPVIHALEKAAETTASATPRSMDTAPKDEHGCLAYSPNFYQDKGGWVAAVWIENGCASAWHANPGGWRFNPTHWLPFPEKPCDPPLNAEPQASANLSEDRREVGPDTDVTRGDVKPGRTGACGSAPAVSAATRRIEGWKLVPIEPTPEMLAVGRHTYAKAAQMWAAMVLAAPLGPVPNNATDGTAKTT